ncbi:hypothetical protein HMI54_005101 [Coelomomyces lativittatus]|nr:hypothetical protein HMI55_003797 [Coelomomyces lativittatus]KAJ1506399.1 hypothetical protein HMI54_005101 [Coelomomyces lativittatus]
MEGGKELKDTIRAMTRMGIPVLGHIGLTPQRIASLGGFRVQGKTANKAFDLFEDAKVLEDAGVFGIVLEAIPEKIASHITSKLRIPTIGIGAGVGCSGQVLVQQDMVGSFDRFIPKFCKKYASVSQTVISALETYCMEVKEKQFPTVDHTYSMPDEEFQAYLEKVSSKES